MSLRSWLGLGDARRQEREAFLAAITAIQDVAVSQTKVMQSLLESWKVTEAPQLREFDGAADTERYLERTYGAQLQAQLPPELRGKDLAEQFSALLNKLDS